MIQAGGDIVVGDAPPGTTGWTIDAPGASAELRSRLRDGVANLAIATSGTGEQRAIVNGIGRSHIVDPRTGAALTTRTTVHVMGPDGAVADALATALVVLPRSDHQGILARFPGYRADVVVHPD
jgi:thiamine biosynthesis lipoprotein